MKRSLFVLLYAAGLPRLAAWWNRKRVVFLCYHGVTERASRNPFDPKGLHVNHRRFAAHLDYLHRNYKVISVSRYLEARREGRPLPSYSVVLTFDDGFRNFLTAAAPRLAERGMPASVFLITDKTSEEAPPNHNQKWAPDDDTTYLSWAEAQTLERKQGIEFGSHTCSHPKMLDLSAADTERELYDSYNALVAHMNLKAPALSYPKGEYSALISFQARRIGYACAVTTDRGANDHDQSLFALGRTLIGDDDDAASFAVRVSGLRQWIVDFRTILRWRVTNKSQDRLIYERPYERPSEYL
jgi:peptidoglycan/xylan/chitin deacetylase (PgdA/CDA1 family)